MQNYTQEQIDDIKAREVKCLVFLKENGFTPSAQVTQVKVGQDQYGEIFSTRVTPYIQDITYSPKESPIQHEDLAKS